jgi:hypothetical protein
MPQRMSASARDYNTSTPPFKKLDGYAIVWMQICFSEKRR